MVCAVEIVIVSGNRRAVLYGDGLRKRSPKIRIRSAAVTDEPACVDVQVHEVCEALQIESARARAANECCERRQPKKRDLFRSL